MAKVTRNPEDDRVLNARQAAEFLPPPSGGRAKKRRDSARVTDTANLKQRFPALKGRH